MFSLLGIPLLRFFVEFFSALLCQFCFIYLNDFITNFQITVLHAALLFSSLFLNVVQTYPQVPKQQTRVNIL